ncbi:MAG: DNA integrity scanning protein DisA [Actinobacteria bacterium]|nr:DNA integrity scanning protein DisA [Actinomycetota bacterium]
MVSQSELEEALRSVAPGTALREALDNIVRAKWGALIVLADESDIVPVISGGIAIDVALTSMILYELAKMDGAILLNREGTRISHANVHLMPDPTIPSVETGTRHRTAERVAKQIDSLVLSISAARDVVSLYLGGMRYVLEDVRVIVTKSNQALQTLERYKSRLNQVSTALSALEFENGVTLHDVLSVLQRSEMVLRIAGEIERYIIELGTEGRLIKMQLDELMVDVREDRQAVLMDYLPNFSRSSVLKTCRHLSNLDAEDLVSLSRVGEILGYDTGVNPIELHLSPRGFHMLRKIPRLPVGVINNLVLRFGSLQKALSASTEELETVEGVGAGRARDIKEGFVRLRELNLLERYG